MLKELGIALEIDPDAYLGYLCVHLHGYRTVCMFTCLTKELENSQLTSQYLDLALSPGPNG